MTNRLALLGPTRRALVALLTLLGGSGIACSGTTIEDDLPVDDELPPRSATKKDGGTGERGGSISSGGEGSSRGSSLPGSSDAGRDARADGSSSTTAACKLDTRTIYVTGGRKVESITAYGKYWSREVKADGSAIEAADFPHSVVSDPKFATGPCSGRSSCTLDTRVVWFDGAQKIESTTAYGTAWQWTFAADGSPVLGGAGAPATSVAAWSAGPCASAGSTCTFDTRVIDTTTGGKVEVITAYGKWYEYALANGVRTPRSTFGVSIESISRFATGACSGQTAGNCALDTRTVYVDLDGSRIEEVTARNRLWVHRLSPSDGVITVLVGGAPIVDTPRLSGPCTHASA